MKVTHLVKDREVIVGILCFNDSLMIELEVPALKLDSSTSFGEHLRIVDMKAFVSNMEGAGVVLEPLENHLEFFHQDEVC